MEFNITMPVKLLLPHQAGDHFVKNLVNRKIIDPEHIIYNRDGTHSYKWKKRGQTFQLEENVNFMTSLDATEMPSDCPEFYQFLKETGAGLCLMWLPGKMDTLEHALESPVFKLSELFESNSGWQQKLNAIGLTCAMRESGRLKARNIFKHHSRGLLTVFDNDTRGEELKHYIDKLTGRRCTPMLPDLQKFFDNFVKGLDCYNLINTKVLEQLVPVKEAPSRLALIARFPLDEKIENMIELIGTKSYYARAREILHHITTSEQDAIKIDFDSGRLRYLSQPEDSSMGSDVAQMAKWLVQPYASGSGVPRDAITFYREYVAVYGLSNSLFGKGVLKFLDDMNKVPPRKRTARLLRDQGAKLIRCHNCHEIFCPAGHDVQWTNHVVLSEEVAADERPRSTGESPNVIMANPTPSTSTAARGTVATLHEILGTIKKEASNNV